MDINQLSSRIIKAAINVHKSLGPGLLGSMYQSCMVIDRRIDVWPDFSFSKNQAKLFISEISESSSDPDKSGERAR